MMGFEGESLGAFGAMSPAFTQKEADNNLPPTLRFLAVLLVDI